MKHLVKKICRAIFRNSSVPVKKSHLRITLILNQIITMRIVILSEDLYKKLSSMLLKVNLDFVEAV